MTAIDKVTVEFVKLRDGNTCVRCGEDADEYVLERRTAGGHGFPNLFLSCEKCVVVLDSRPQNARSFGFTVPAHRDPAAVPIDSYLHGWILLRADGTWTPAHEDVVERWLDECTWGRG